MAAALLNVVAVERMKQRSLIHVAAGGDVIKVNSLIDDGADVNQVGFVDWSSEVTPLHIAAKYGRTEVVDLLLSKGAHVDAQQKDGRTALHNAAKRGHLPVVKRLVLEGANIELRDKNNRTPLDEARRKNRQDIVGYFEQLESENATAS